MVPFSSESEIFITHFNGPRLPDPRSPGATEGYDALARAALCLRTVSALTCDWIMERNFFLERESWFQLPTEAETRAGSGTMGPSGVGDGR